MLFKNRFDAAEKLAKKLIHYKNSKDAVILAIPRGALEIGNVLAKRLNLQLDIILTKKIPHPYSEEYAIGAVSLKNYVVDETAVNTENVSEDYIKKHVKEIRKNLKEKYKKYIGEEPINLKGKIVIIIDDGIATGNTIKLAIDMARKEKAKKVVVAIPVAPSENIIQLKELADEVVCLETPFPFFAIGQFYETFTQVDDDEAIRLLKEVR